MKRIFAFLQSIRLAIVLLLYLAGTSILATFIPQGKEIGFYYNSYSEGIASLIVSTHFHEFFTSILFLAPVGLFFVNLLVCAVDRLVRELQHKKKRRFGPDFVHLGLLVLIIGAVISFTGKKEGFVYLSEGEKLQLPGEYVVTLETFEFLRYENGRPKDWISTVDVHHNGEKIIDSYPIEVNRPLRVGNMKVYQSSYSIEERLVFTTPTGEKKRLPVNHPINTDRAAYVFKGIERGPGSGEGENAVIEKWQQQQRTDVLTLEPGQRFGPGYTVQGVQERMVTGLRAKIDPGFIPVLIALVIIGFGLSLTYIQKIREMEQ